MNGCTRCDHLRWNVVRLVGKMPFKLDYMNSSARPMTVNAVLAHALLYKSKFKSSMVRSLMVMVMKTRLKLKTHINLHLGKPPKELLLHPVACMQLAILVPHGVPVPADCHIEFTELN